MNGPCHPDFERLATELGDFACADQNLLVNLHNPFGLDHWTMLLIEVAMVVGAVLALRHALRRRRQGDPRLLAIWIASLAYLVVVEPPLYFPDQFGLQEQTGLIFVHNEFTVQFLWNRLPLYIVSIYPVLATLTFELVRLTGVMDRRGPVVSALTVGFTFHVIYEFFDHIGPQLSWWIWNPTAPSNEPFLASVPISSMVNFAVVGPAVLAFLVLVLVGRRNEVAVRETGVSLSTRTLVGRGVLAGVVMPIGLVLGGLPATVFRLVGDEVNTTAQAVAYWLILAVTSAVAIHALWDAERARVAVDDEPAKRYVGIHAAIFLGAMTASWLVALPEYFGAVDGITASGTPIGSLPYAVVCLVASMWLVWFATRSTPPVPAGEQQERVPIAA